MKTILIPTDFSTDANNALEYGLDIATESKAKVVLLNAYEIPYTASSIMSDKIFGVLEEGSLKGLEELAQKLREKHPQVEIGIKAYRGDLKNYVSAASFQQHYDMIVMGTKGAGSIENVIFGSTTTAVLEKSAVPVLAVPAKAQYGAITSIAYASDYQKEDLEIIQKLTDIARSFKASIKIVHIVEQDFDDFEEIVRFKGFQSMVKESINFEGISFDKVVADNFEKGLNQYISEHKISLLALTTHKRSFLAKLLVPSLTKMIAMHAEVPVISFRVS